MILVSHNWTTKNMLTLPTEYSTEQGNKLFKNIIPQQALPQSGPLDGIEGSLIVQEYYNIRFLL